MKNKKLHLILTALMLSASAAFSPPSHHDLLIAKRGITLTQIAETSAEEMTFEVIKILKHFLGVTITKDYIPDETDITEAIRRPLLIPDLKHLVIKNVQMMLTDFLEKLDALGKPQKENRW